MMPKTKIAIPVTSRIYRMVVLVLIAMFANPASCEQQQLWVKYGKKISSFIYLWTKLSRDSSTTV